MRGSQVIIVALNNLEKAEKIKNILCMEGYNVVAVCTSGNDLIRRALIYDECLIVIGYNLIDMNINEVYDALSETCSFLALVNEPYKSFVEEKTDMYCISNPINKIVLGNAIDMIIQGQKRLHKLKEKIEGLECKIEERKNVEKAKGILMDTLGFTENEAFKYIQKNSMKTGLKMNEIAKKIIAS